MKVPKEKGEIRVFKSDEPSAYGSVTVSQSALGEHSLALSPMVVVLEDGNLEAEVDVTADIHGWSFEIIDGGEWMDVSKDDDKLLISADPLRIPYRNGRIDVTSAGKSLTVYVLQGDFRTVSASTVNAVYYGRLNEMPFTTSLINVSGEKYASPFVGQEYQDQINIQLNTRPIVDFKDFSLEDGKYPISIQADDLDNYCSAGFFDDDMGVYGSCWLRRWYYMGEDYGFNGLYIFQKGDVYIVTDGDTASIYIAATGLNQEFSSETFTIKIKGTTEYFDAVNSRAGARLKGFALKNY